jgi:hypothetical protein
MRQIRAYFHVGYLGLLALLATLFVGGCASPDNENISARPWNTPKGWENGMPSNLMDRK